MRLNSEEKTACCVTGYLLVIVVIFLVIWLGSGCANAVTIAHANRETQIMDAARSIYELAYEIPREPEHTLEIIKEIQEDALDVYERGRIGQKHFGGQPKDAILRKSPADDDLFHADAGHAHAKDIQRRNRKELGEKTAKAVASWSTKVVRNLWNGLPFIVQVVLIYLAYVWVRKALDGRDGVLVKMLAKSDLSKDEKRQITEGTPVQDKYRKEKNPPK